MKGFCSILVGSAFALLTVVSVAAADEHPKEHPQEHPGKAVSIEGIDKAIRDHVSEQSKADGKFHVKDTVLDKTWDLFLVSVHKDKLAALQNETYFACVDFKAGEGTMVDVDFFLKNDKGKLVVTDTSVHKINGKARYMYQYSEKDRYWVRVDVDKTKETP